MEYTEPRKGIWEFKRQKIVRILLLINHENTDLYCFLSQLQYVLVSHSLLLHWTLFRSNLAENYWSKRHHLLYHLSSLGDLGREFSFQRIDCESSVRWQEKRFQNHLKTNKLPKHWHQNGWRPTGKDYWTSICQRYNLWYPIKVNLNFKMTFNSVM